MSDAIKHECGIALIRLLKPLDYYVKKYGTAFYGLNKLYLLMEKQHNRGQDGAGIANIKFDMEPGKRYISRKRCVGPKPIQEIFEHINAKFADVQASDPEKFSDPYWLKENYGFTGELWLGHLRYGTFGKNSIEACHPFLRQNNWTSRNLVCAGNFNLTNVDELFDQLVRLGQHPKQKADTVTVMEKIGHFLDVEVTKLHGKYKQLGYSNQEISSLIEKNLNIQQILTNSADKWDGGYAMVGLMGHGDAFVLRDPAGVRPAFYYQDDEVVVVTSERPAIQTSFNIQDASKIKELTPGHALIIKKAGEVGEHKVREPLPKKACSFERIYFSRGNDVEIYQERKELGRLIIPQVLSEVDYDLKNTVFSFIPNTAETSFYGMIDGLHDYMDELKQKLIQEKGPAITDDEIIDVLSLRPRIEKIAIKDAKLRTFITEDASRDDLVAHVYDTTYGTINEHVDNLVIIDDSIVRGTTLKKSILRMLDRLGPKKIVVVSSAPQIRYPDCYGIDMAKLGDFIAFRAAIELLKERGKEQIIRDVYNRAKEQVNVPKEQVVNFVKMIYKPFTAEEISDKIAQLLTPEDLNADVKIIYQSIYGLHRACPKHLGDWYFTGNYPTPGGNKVVNQAFINYVENRNVRAY